MNGTYVTLGDIAEIYSGYAFKSSNMSEQNGIPLIKIKNISNRNVSEECDTFLIQDSLTEAMDRFILHQGDFLVAMTGQGSVGRIGRMKRVLQKYYVNQRVAIVRTNTRKANSDYVFFYIATSQNEKVLFDKANGAGQPNISAKQIGELPILLPDIEEQNKIASILSAYDDLIENNQKQIKLLEEAAQRLYKEWFVDLRFPGWETAEIVDGVPEGWSSTLLKDTIEYEIGGGWGEEEVKEQCEAPAFVIRGTDLYGVTHGDFLSVPYRFHKKSNLESRRLQNGDIIFEVSGGSKTEGVARTTRITAALLEQFSSPVMCASFCKLVRPKEELSQLLYDHFIFLRASGKTSEYDKKSASSIVNYRWKDFLVQESVLIPSNEILVQYNQCANSIYEKIVTCSIIVEKAKATRDRLLPKLMSGELEV